MFAPLRSILGGNGVAEEQSHGSVSLKKLVFSNVLQNHFNSRSVICTAQNHATTNHYTPSFVFSYRDNRFSNPALNLLLHVVSYLPTIFFSVSLFCLFSLLFSFWPSSDPSLAGRERRGGGGRGAGRENGRLSLHGAPLTSQRYPGESEATGLLVTTLSASRASRSYSNPAGSMQLLIKSF